MRSNRAGLGNLVMWLASGDRKRAAWSLSLYEVTAGAKRSGNKARNAGLAAQAGKAIAKTTGDTWGGLDFLASDAFVAEEHVTDREFVVKDSADEDTPGMEPWSLDKNIRLAKPLEALVARSAKVGPGFENEHVAYPMRAQLIAHHRPDDPPINSTWVYDPGDGKPGDWRAGLHGPVRVRRWVDQFCAAAPNPKDTAASFEEPADTFALLLNATKSGGDNSGWLGAHFEQAEAVLSAEAFGFAHPADDGFHIISQTADAQILEGGLEAFRTKFGSRGSLLYSPLQMSPDQWPFPGKQIIPVLTEIQEDYTATHGKLCGTAPGYKKLVTWIPIYDWGPPAVPPPDNPPEEPPTDGPPVTPKYPRLIKGPNEGGPDLFGDRTPASHSGGDDGRSIDDLQRDYPAAGIVPPANFGERSAAVMSQLEGTSMQYRARPALPDGRLSLYARGGNEADDLAGLMYGYTLREALSSPVVADDVAAPNYLHTSAQAHDLPNNRWPVQLSNEAELTENPVGGITGRVPARGPGSVFSLPSNVPVDWQFSENKERWTGSPNAMLRAIMAGKNAAGVTVAGKGGIGLRNLAGDLVSGWQWALDFSSSATEPDINFTKRDATGANAGAGKFKINGVEVGSGGAGDITSSANLTSNRLPRGTGLKQIDTDIDLTLNALTIDAPADTVQLLTGPGLGLQLRSPTRMIFNLNGVDELVLTPGKMTYPGLIDPKGLALTPVAANPGGALAATTLFSDSTASNRFKVGTNTLAYLSEVPSISGLLVAANNLSDVGSKPTSLYNLLNGLAATIGIPGPTTKLGIIEGSTAVYATLQQVLDAINGLSVSTPILSDVVPFTNGAGQAKAATPQKLLDLIASLSAVTPALSDIIPATQSGVAKAVTPQKLLDLIHSTTAKTTLAANDEFALIDSAASNVAKRITFANVQTALAASDTVAGLIEYAVQSEMETGTSNVLAVTPGRQHFHPGHPKAWGYATVSAGTPTLQTSYNITSISDSAVGQITFTINNDFSTANWSAQGNITKSGTGASNARFCNVEASGLAAGSVLLMCSGTASLSDPAAWHFMGNGDL